MVPNPAEEQGPSGARPVEQSQHQTEGATFVNVVAHALHAMLGQNAFKDLVLVAPPETLGELRSAIHKTVAATVVRSLSKDLTHQTTRKSRRHSPPDRRPDSGPRASRLLVAAPPGFLVDE